MKVVINNCFGGFGLNSEAMAEYCRRKGVEKVRDHRIPRDDTDLVALVEKGGADTRYSRLVVIEIPDGVDWQIEEYDGLEHIAEAHRTWP